MTRGEQTPRNPGTVPEGTVPADLEQQVKELEAARDSAIADLQRVAADFDNFRKRTARDQESLIARAHERLVKELLPVLDDLETGARRSRRARGGQARGGRAGSSIASCRTCSQKEGLVAVETEGKFDPHEHEALLTQPSEAEEGAILEVIQKGYRLGDRVLRPARVVVSAGGDAND